MRTDRGHETADIKPRGIVIFLIALTVVTILVLVAMRALFVALENRAEEADRAASRAAFETPTGGGAKPATPLLQANPPVALAEMRAAEEKILSTYGWVNTEVGIARIPIDRAIDLLAERGLPARALEAAAHDGDAAVPGDVIPRDANSGRGAGASR